MKRCTALAAFALCGLFARAALADQCAWVSPSVAARASNALADRAMVVDYCEPCGDQTPGAPRPVGEVKVQPVGHDLREVVIDGRGIDLAYTYLRTAGDRYDNLAAVVGCPATGVSRSLQVDSPTATGVSTRATDNVAPPAEPEGFAEPPPPAPSAEPAPVVHIHTVEPISPGWIIALIACGGIAIGGLGLAVLELARRRRRTFLPRALALADRREPPH